MHKVSRDVALDDVAQRYRTAMAKAVDGTLTEFSLAPYDRTGIPVQATVWDDHNGDAHGVGYGVTESHAAVGALGELAERVLLRSTLQQLPVRRASFADLTAELGAEHVADPVSLILDAAADYSPERPLWWVPARRWRTGEQVWVPAEFAAFDPGSLPARAAEQRDGLITPITNGMGAGDSLVRAVGHGLLELLQRDGDNVVFRALDQGVVLDVGASTDPDLRAALAALRGAGIEPMVKLASTEFACVTYCVGLDDDDRTPVAALGAVGEAAHPDRDVSVTKSLLEFASSRARRVFAFGPLADVERHHPDYLRAELSRPIGEQEPRALREMTAWTRMSPDEMRTVLTPLFGRSRTVGLDDVPTQGVDGVDQLLDTLLQRLAAFDVLVVAAPDTDDAATDDMVAAKVIVPGLEVETMSYLRIGERALRQLLARDSDLVGLGRPDRPTRLPVRLTASAAGRIGGPAWIDSAAVSAAVDTLYPLYREPRRHSVHRVH